MHASTRNPSNDSAVERVASAVISAASFATLVALTLLPVVTWS